MTGPRVGSLFSGYGGLDLGVQSALGGTVAWHCDFDAGPSKVLAHHWPDVPNLHDVTDVDWASVEPVDVITGGSPCQDVSAAGKRAGMRAGTRSGLWASMCDAIDIIRPGLVVWENVRGAYSAAADSNVEPCPFCVGDGDRVHLRALGRVLGDLAEIGYDAWWTGLRAADAGAPHSRFRVFVFAWPAGTDSSVLGRRSPRRDDGLRPEGLVPGSPQARGLASPDAGGGELQRRGNGRDLVGPSGPGEGNRSERQRDGHTAGHRGAATTYPPGDGRQRDGSPRDGRPGPAHDDLTAAYPEGHGRHEGRPQPAGLVGGPDASVGGDAVPHPDGLGQQGVGRVERLERDPDGRGGAQVAWGDYQPAIRRWEDATAREAPAPTELGRTGQPRLSPTFVEWLMGLPAGHVTAVPGLSRNEQLKLLGNGVVPQQAALATRQFLAARPWEVTT